MRTAYTGVLYNDNAGGHKMEHEAIGHYARPDVLELKVNEK